MLSARLGQRERRAWRILSTLQRMFLGLAIVFSVKILWIPSSSMPLTPIDMLDNDPSLAQEPFPRRENLTVFRNPTTGAKLQHPHFSIDFPLCLVHIGKAAGSSVSCGLGLTYADCEGLPRDALNNTHYFHMRRNTCPSQSKGNESKRVNPSPKQKQSKPIITQSYLVTLRNPITRLHSWFEFEKDIVPTRGRNSKMQDQIKRQRAMLFQECYSSFEKLVSDGLRLPPEHSKTNWTISASKPEDMTCVERAWAAVMGVRAFSYHEWYNYEYYWTGIVNHGYQQRKKKHGLLDTNASPSAAESFANADSTAPKLYALRTEHLQDDWQSVSKEPLFRPVNRRGNKIRLVGTTDVSLSTNTTLSAFRRDSVKIDSSPSDTIDGSTQFQFSLSILCQALCPEIQYYKRFLHNSVNLNGGQLKKSISEVQAYCPFETHRIREDCPGLPTFPLMEVPIGKYRSEVKKRLYKIKSRKT